MISPTSAVGGPRSLTPAGFRQREPAPGQGHGELFPTSAVAGSEPTGDTSTSRPPVGVMLNTAGLCLGDARSPFYETQQKPRERGQ